MAALIPHFQPKTLKLSFGAVAAVTRHGRTSSPSRLQIAGEGAGYPERYHQRVGYVQQPLLPPLAVLLQAEDALEWL